jgi:hypothetical protein
LARWPFVRDVVLFLAGLLGVAHETLLENSDRPELLLMFGAMMGLPAFLQADTRLDKRKPRRRSPDRDREDER